MMDRWVHIAEEFRSQVGEDAHLPARKVARRSDNPSVTAPKAELDGSGRLVLEYDLDFAVRTQVPDLIPGMSVEIRCNTVDERRIISSRLSATFMTSKNEGAYRSRKTSETSLVLERLS